MILFFIYSYEYSTFYYLPYNFVSIIGPHRPMLNKN